MAWPVRVGGTGAPYCCPYKALSWAVPDVGTSVTLLGGQDQPVTVPMD